MKKLIINACRQCGYTGCKKRVGNGLIPCNCELPDASITEMDEAGRVHLLITTGKVTSNDKIPDVSGQAGSLCYDLRKVAAVIVHYTTGIFGNKVVIPALPWSVDNLAAWFIKYAIHYRVELEMMLAQAVAECHFGVDPNAGRSRRTMNIFNVGNTDKPGDDEIQTGWEAGIERYARLMHEEYNYHDNTEGWVTMRSMVAHDYVRPAKGRYASDPNYTKTVKSIYDGIVKLGVKA